MMKTWIINGGEILLDQKYRRVGVTDGMAHMSDPVKYLINWTHGDRTYETVEQIQEYEFLGTIGNELESFLRTGCATTTEEGLLDGVGRIKVPDIDIIKGFIEITATAYQQPNNEFIAFNRPTKMAIPLKEISFVTHSEPVKIGLKHSPIVEVSESYKEMKNKIKEAQ